MNNKIFLRLYKMIFQTTINILELKWKHIFHTTFKNTDYFKNTAVLDSSKEVVKFRSLR